MLESNLMKDARRLLLLELIALTAILLVAAALRLYRLLDVPPGFHFDEAIDLKIALDVLHGARLIYTPEGWGREALYYYPAALMLRLVAYNPLALRATAALFGLALIGVSYALARRLHGRMAALLTAAWLAVAMWPVWAARFGVRHISLALLLGLAAWAFWWAFQRIRNDELGIRKYLPFALAGILLGLTAYTYQPARFVPLLFGGFGVYLALCHRRSAWANRRGWLVWGVSAAAVALPLVLVLSRATPVEVGERAFSIEPLTELLAGNPRPVLDNLVATAKVFTVAGDPLKSYNLPGRPLFVPRWTGLFFYAGLALAVWRWRRPAYAFVLLWLVVALLPTVVTISAPNFNRMVAAQFPIFFLAAVAAAETSAWLATRRLPARGVAALSLVAALVVLAALALTAQATIRDLFHVWPEQFADVHPLNREIAAVADFLEHAADGRPVVISSRDIEDEDPYIVSVSLDRAIDRRWVDTSQALALPAGADEAWLIVTADRWIDPVLMAWVGEEAQGSGGAGEQGRGNVGEMMRCRGEAAAMGVVETMGLVSPPPRPLAAMGVVETTNLVSPPPRPLAAMGVVETTNLVSPPPRPLAAIDVVETMGLVSPPPRPLVAMGVVETMGLVSPPPRPLAAIDVVETMGLVSPPPRPLAAMGVVETMGLVSPPPRPLVVVDVAGNNGPCLAAASPSLGMVEEGSGNRERSMPVSQRRLSRLPDPYATLDYFVNPTASYGGMNPAADTQNRLKPVAGAALELIDGETTGSAVVSNTNRITASYGGMNPAADTQNRLKPVARAAHERIGWAAPGGATLFNPIHRVLFASRGFQPAAMGATNMAAPTAATAAPIPNPIANTAPRGATLFNPIYRVLFASRGFEPAAMGATNMAAPTAAPIPNPIANTAPRGATLFNPIYRVLFASRGFQPAWLQPAWLQPAWLQPAWLQPAWPQPTVSQPAWLQPATPAATNATAATNPTGQTVTANPTTNQSHPTSQTDYAKGLFSLYHLSTANWPTLPTPALTLPPESSTTASPIYPIPFCACEPGAAVAPALWLTGIEPGPAVPGAELTVLTSWRTGPARFLSLAMFVHLLDANGAIVAQDDGLGYPPHTWQPGDRFLQLARLPLPPDLPPGAYTLQFGLYDRASGARWPLLGPDGQPAADRLLLMTNDE